MVRAGLGWLAAADATALGAGTGAVPGGAGAGRGDGDRGAGLGAGGVHLGQGYCRGRAVQPAGLADPPDPDHQGRRGRAYGVGAADGPRAPAGAALAAGADVGVVGRPICTWTDTLPPESRRLRTTILLSAAAGRAGAAGPGRLARECSSSRPASRRGPGRRLEDRAVQADHDLRGGGGAARRPDPACTAVGPRSLTPSRPGRGAGHPHPGAAVSRRAAGGHAAAAGGGAAAGPPGSPQGPGPRVPGRPDAAGRQLRPDAGVDHVRAGAVGGAPGRCVAGRQ